MTFFGSVSAQKTSFKDGLVSTHAYDPVVLQKERCLSE